MNTPNNEPVFGIPGWQQGGVQTIGGARGPAYTGLTKRELFAAMAMQGSLGGVPGSHLVPPNLAKLSVEYADALLAALSDESAQMPSETK